MTTPSFIHIDDIFTDKQFLIDQSTSLYNSIIQENPEVENGYLFVVLYNKDPLNNLVLEKPNLYSITYQNKTFYKKISNGNLYRNSFSIENDGMLDIKDIYWLFLDSQLDSWKPFSSNYIISENNNFNYIWYNFTNFKYTLNNQIDFMGNYFYSQPIIRKNSDLEFFNDIPIHTEQNKSIFINDSTNLMWSSSIVEKYLRVYIQGYKSTI